MNAGLTMQRVYDTLRAELVAGVYPAGTRLEPERLADALHASATPVRDALHRLTGERLLIARPHKGFHVPMLTERDLRHMYGWSLDVLLASLQATLTDPLPMTTRKARIIAPTAADPAQGMATLFDAIATETGNPEYSAAVASLNARLNPARLAECRLIAGIERDIQPLRHAWADSDIGGLGALLLAFHRRRIDLAPKIAALLMDVGRNRTGE